MTTVTEIERHGLFINGREEPVGARAVLHPQPG